MIRFSCLPEIADCPVHVLKINTWLNCCLIPNNHHFPTVLMCKFKWSNLWRQVCPGQHSQRYCFLMALDWHSCPSILTFARDVWHQPELRMGEQFTQGRQCDGEGKRSPDRADNLNVHYTFSLPQVALFSLTSAFHSEWSSSISLLPFVSWGGCSYPWRLHPSAVWLAQGLLRCYC